MRGQIWDHRPPSLYDGEGDLPSPVPSPPSVCDVYTVLSEVGVVTTVGESWG